MLQTSAWAQEDASCKIVHYNNSDLVVDLGVGLWGIPIPTDYDGDGITDLIVSCPDKPYKGLYLFRNIGTLDKPLFDKAKLINEKGYNNIKISVVDGEEYVLSAGKEWTNFNKKRYSAPKEITYTGEVLGATYKKSRSNMWSYVDWEKDGDIDILVGTPITSSFPAPDKGLPWSRSPIKGLNILYFENIGTNSSITFADPKQLLFRGKDLNIGTLSIAPTACPLGEGGLLVGSDCGAMYYFSKEDLARTISLW